MANVIVLDSVTDQPVAGAPVRGSDGTYLGATGADGLFVTTGPGSITINPETDVDHLGGYGEKTVNVLGNVYVYLDPSS